MLVLTRRPGQAIAIGDSIEVYIAEVRGDQVRLSIRAPADVAILRREVLEAVQRENREAAAAGPEVLAALAGLGPCGLACPGVPERDRDPGGDGDPARNAAGE